MINAKTTSGKTMTSVDPPNRQLRERDLAITPVLSAKSFQRVNALVRRRPHPLARPPTLGALGRAVRSRTPPTIDNGIPPRGRREIILRRSGPARRALAQRTV